MKKQRLDQILMRLGYITDEDIRQALMRQKARGGRIGSHLVYHKAITEQQLVEALAEQHGVDGFRPEEHEISPELARKLPVEIAEDYGVLPISTEADTGIASIAVIDPGDMEMLGIVRKALGARKVKVYVAPESLLRLLITRHYRGNKTSEVDQIVELPELFDGDVIETSFFTDSAEPKTESRNILMVSDSTSLRNFLVPVFARENTKLSVVANEAEVTDALLKEPFDQVLVSQHLLHDFLLWLRNRNILEERIEVSTFTSISNGLLENPVPYRRIIRSLFRSLQVIAEMRCADAGWIPPYALICNDIRRLSRTFRLRRLITDGLQIAAYLLIPSPTAESDGPVPGPLSFIDFDRSLEIARSLHFPWNIHDALQEFFELVSGAKAPADTDRMHTAVHLGAQILALVWHYRVAMRHADVAPDGVPRAVRSELREQAGRLADLEVIESYIRLLETNSEEPDRRPYNQIFIVSETDDILGQFSARLNQSGFPTVHIGDLAEAQRMCERQAPVAILIDRDCYPNDILKASRMFKLNAVVLLYAFTRTNDPSLTLDLLDAGFDDVFVPPYDFDVITARINKSLRGLTQNRGRKEKPGGFRATFKAFSQIDLLQALGQSLKTVYIHLESGSGETAKIYMRRGQMVHAVSGKLKGEEAVYEVIRWGDDGAFTVEPEDRFPPDNISESNEAILMEGCRLLDESRI